MATKRLTRRGVEVRLSLIFRRRFEIRSNDLPRFLAWHNRNDFKGCAGTPPLQDPFLQEPHVAAAHELEATAKVGLYPAINVFQTFRQRTPNVPQALIDRDHIIVAKSLDDHEQHDDPDLVHASLAGRKTPGKRFLRYWTKPERSATPS